jgi:menaquinone-specific isochorismate synthase
MTAAAMPSGRVDAWAASGGVAAGLAIAAGSNALTFVALPAPVASAAAILEAFPHQPRVAWTSGELTLVGIGCARELRGSGDGRWADVVRAARELEIAGAVIGGAPAAVSALGGARPRFVGGAAFAPGAAGRAPWHGFGDAWFVLPRWTYVSGSAGAHLVLAIDARDAGNATRWYDELAQLHAAFTARVTWTQPAVVELARGSAAQWRDQVVTITDAIANGACSKIVAARTCSLALAGAVRPASLFAALSARHPDCVCVLVQPPGGGALIAATPERLVRRDRNQVWCDALAGTRSIAPPGDPAADPAPEPPEPRESYETSAIHDVHDVHDAHGAQAAQLARIAAASTELLASHKDRREHALVVQAIRAALDDCPEVDMIDAPAVPEVRSLRHVVHLHTPFRARLREPLHVLELAARLHPTPAVGGTPGPVAIDWIRRHEPVARGWYAAPVGWFDLDGNGELAVAIRSGVLAGNRAHLWAGAGIVAGSDPDRELAETELKFRAMLGALGVTGEAGGPGGGEDA